MSNYAELDKRVQALEQRNREIGDVADLVLLLRDVRGALSLFVKIGNALKWLVGVGVAIAGPYYAIKHWLGG